MTDPSPPGGDSHGDAPPPTCSQPSFPLSEPNPPQETIDPEAVGADLQAHGRRTDNGPENRVLEAGEVPLSSLRASAINAAPEARGQPARLKESSVIDSETERFNDTPVPSAAPQRSAVNATAEARGQPSRSMGTILFPDLTKDLQMLTMLQRFNQGANTAAEIQGTPE